MKCLLTAFLGWFVINVLIYQILYNYLKSLITVIVMHGYDSRIPPHPPKKNINDGPLLS